LHLLLHVVLSNKLANLVIEPTLGEHLCMLMQGPGQLFSDEEIGRFHWLSPLPGHAPCHFTTPSADIGDNICH
jgi:hypothetical protein